MCCTHNIHVYIQFHTLTCRRAQQFYLQVSAWMIRMESDLNPTAGAKSSSQALKMDINSYAALFLQVLPCAFIARILLAPGIGSEEIMKQHFTP